MGFDGLRVLSFESRRAAEIGVLIRKQGGEPFVAPSVKERVLENHGDAFRLLESLESHQIDLLILTTGVGLSFWRGVVAERFPVTRVDEALRSVKLLARGPKPAAVLRSAGLSPDITVPEPNTWREVVAAVRPRPERRIGILEYGRPNHELIEELRRLGADVKAFALYRWELPDDTEPLREAVRRLAAHETDVVLFTSSIQLEHLLAVASESSAQNAVLKALRDDAVIASVGPIMNETLAEHGVQPDIVPGSPKMGPLVIAAAENAAAMLAKKRGGRD